MALQSQVDALVRNVSEWNRWREANPDTGINLQRASLQDKNLERANLANADMGQAVLHRANLAGADLRHAVLEQSSLTLANLEGANFENANLVEANLTGARLNGANLCMANLEGVRLDGVDLSEMDLELARLSRSKFSGGSVLSGVKAAKAVLDEAILAGATLEGIDLTEASLRRIKANESNFRGAKLRRADLSDSNLSDCTLSEADLTDANLTRANLSGATLTGAKMSGILLELASLRRTNLQDVDLKRSDLSNADLENAKLTGADLRGANLTGATLTGVEFVGLKLDRSTVLRNLRFADDHDELNDGADALGLSEFNRHMNWARLRFLSEVPLFGASYVALALLFILVHGVDAANTLGLRSFRSGLEAASDQLAIVSTRLDVLRAEHPNASEYLGTQIAALNETLTGLESAIRAFSTQLPQQLTLPPETLWATTSAVLLVLGTTIYAVFCPATVKRFSETEWVAQLRRPRLLYIADSLGCRSSRWGRWSQTGLQLSAGLFVGLGGIIGIGLLGIRIYKLFRLGLEYSSWI